MKNRKKFILTFILFIICIIIIIVTSFILSKNFVSNGDGNIHVNIIDIDNNIIMEKHISFKTGDTLQYLLEKNFSNVSIENGMIISIENFTTPPDWSTFILIYVDNKISQVGLFDIKFKDGTLISFVITEFIF